MALRVEGLEKRHPGAAVAALRGVSFVLETGACGALLGPSGSGKSTLLRCLVGLDAFDRGTVEIDGVRITEDGSDTRAQRRQALATLRGRTGLVFQSFELFPHLSILENCVLAPIRVRGRTRAEATGQAMELLGRLGLAEKAHAHPEALSGGQRQRAAIARALAMEPRVLLYDEPTSALDPRLRDEVRRTLEAVGATGITQLVVTHDIAFAREATQVTFVLEAGRIVRSGPSREVAVDA